MADKNNDQEEIEELFPKKDRRKKPEKNNNNRTVIYLVSLGALLLIWIAAFAQPLAYRTRLLPFIKKEKQEYIPKKEEKKEEQKKEEKKSEKKQDNKSDNKIPPAHDDRWDIGFVDMDLTNKKGQAVEVSSPSYTYYKAYFNVSFEKPGDEITYDLVIKNNGTIDAKVSSIVVTPEYNNTDPILFKVSGIKIGDEVDAGKTHKLKVNIKYNPNYQGQATLIKEELSVYINYVQK